MTFYCCEENETNICYSNHLIEKSTSKKLPFWTEKEDKIILELGKSMKRNKWIEAAKFVDNKTPRHCYFRYKTINPEYKKGFWTKDEDELLLKYIKLFGNNWSAIAKLMKTRSNKQIHNRFKIINTSSKIKKTNNSESDKNYNIENQNLINKPKIEFQKSQIYIKNTSNNLEAGEVICLSNCTKYNINDIDNVCKCNKLNLSNYENVLYNNINKNLFGFNNNCAPPTNFNLYPILVNNFNQVNTSNLQYIDNQSKVENKNFYNYNGMQI
jgi:hypothetical protein